jgi:hypothetical protein
MGIKEQNEENETLTRKALAVITGAVVADWPGKRWEAISGQFGLQVAVIIRSGFPK